MKNIRISTKIWLGFSCMLVFLFIIAGTTVISSIRTGSNIDEVDIYVGMENSANEMIHILNETRITSAVFYETHSAGSYKDMAKQLQYSDFRLKKLYEYIDSYPEFAALRARIEDFDALYTQWRTGIAALGGVYDFESEFTEQEAEAFAHSAGDLRRVNLRAHEMLSNTIDHISEISARKTGDTKSFHSIALFIVLAVSGVSLAAAIVLSFLIIRSIVKPIGYMRDVLISIGQTGDLRISEQMQRQMDAVAQGRDESAQCTSALLVLIERLHSIDELLSYVADGDLTVKAALQSQNDTIGLAVDKMLQNLNLKFGTIVQATTSVKQKAEQLSEGSRLLSDGSKDQAHSVELLSGSVSQIVDKIGKNTELSKEAAQLSDNIQQNAHSGTEQMIRMTQAAADINTASQAIAKVIKVIDDIAFQTNILALNAAVEAARAGQHGKGFSVVAQEVRNLATKSAEAAKDTGDMIENTIQKAKLGSSIAKATSESLEGIVRGVERSNALMSRITGLSEEQSDNIREIIGYVEHVEKIVEQNDMIATQSATAAGEISDQTHMLHELVEQFRLLDNQFEGR